MTVTPIDARRNGSTAKSDDRRLVKSDDRRLWLTAGELLARAYALIEHYGHHSGDGFGAPRVGTGFSLPGAIYLAAGFYSGENELLDPALCQAHHRRGDEPVLPCARGCEHPLWTQCNLAFSYLAEAMRTSTDEPLQLAGLTARARDFGRVVEVSESLDNDAALRLIARVLRALVVAPMRMGLPQVSTALVGVA